MDRKYILNLHLLYQMVSSLSAGDQIQNIPNLGRTEMSQNLEKEKDDYMKTTVNSLTICCWDKDFHSTDQF